MEPRWILADVVPAIHNRQLAEHGGGEGIRDPGLLDSALARPLNRWTYGDPAPTLCELAAAYGFGIIRNHPFVDGNKRTGLVLTLLFLRLNGLEIEASQEEKYLTVIALAEGNLDEQQFAEWLASKASSGALG